MARSNHLSRIPEIRCLSYLGRIDMARNKSDAPDCPYNEGVGCYFHKCQHCGWHPDVEAQRKEQLGVKPEEK